MLFCNIHKNSFFSKIYLCKIFHLKFLFSNENILAPSSKLLTSMRLSNWRMMYKYNVLVIIIIWVCLLLQIDPDVVLWSCQYTQWLFRTRTTNAVLWYFSFLSLYGTYRLVVIMTCNLRKDCAKYLQRCFNFIVSVNYGIPW